MRGQTNSGSEEAAGEHAPGERRASIEVLQSLLTKVSPSPLHHKYSTLVSSDTSGSTQSDSENQQNGDYSAADVRSDIFNENPKMETSRLRSPGVQDGGGDGWSRTNPFYSYYLESQPTSTEKSTSNTTDPQGASIKLENGSAEHPKVRPWTPTPVPRVKKMPESGSTNESRDVTLDTPENLSKNISSDSIDGDVEDVFHNPKHEEKATQMNSSVFVDPFKSSSNKDDDLFQIPWTRVKQSSRDLMDDFSPSSSNSVDPFASPITKNLFPDFSGLDDSAKEPEPLQRSYSRRFVRPPPGKEQSKTFDTPTSVLPDDNLFKASSSNPQGSDVPNGILLTTPNGTSHDVLQESPVVRPRNPSASPGNSPAEMDHVQTFRRPPRPLPRTRPRRPDKPPKPTDVEPKVVVPKASPKLARRPLPKLPVGLKQKTQSNSVDPENFVVFEDILLIGQEQCVEDWPEDSPELQPDFKPGGTLRLRRESISLKAESDGGSGEDQSGPWSHGKKKDKLRVSMLSRRGSKDKFPEDTKENKSHTLPLPRKSSKEHFPDYSEKEEEDTFSDAGYKKTPLKTKMNKLLRRASTASTKYINKGKGSASAQQEDSSGDEESGGRHDDDSCESNKKKKLNMKFVPQRGFAISMDKKPQGAEGYTPRKGSLMDDDLKKPQHTESGSCRLAEDYEAEDCKPQKKSTMKKLLHRRHRSSKEDTLDDFPKKGSFSADSLDEEHHGMDDYNVGDYEAEEARASRSPRAVYEYDVDDLGEPKQKKSSKLKVFKKYKAKSKRPKESFDLPPGAPPGLSEAAKAAWTAAQIDERTMEGLEDEDADGDTDSLMEWWNTVEQWDEVPSDDENQMLQDDESKSFTILADKVDRGLRVFNKVFTERAELLWQYIITLHAIADDISAFHHKAKIANITGGTTTAVGGVTAIAGLALAPVTFGISLVVTAVGLGVATAGGIASASATISDNVNNMHDRKKVESLLLEYEENLQDIAKILHFVNHGMYKLRGHPFLRSGTQHYSQDWEIRRAVQMISMADAPVMHATEVTDEALSTLQGLFQGMDKYFIKDSRELKKGCKKEIVSQIKSVASMLNDAIVELNQLREALQEAFGSL